MDDQDIYSTIGEEGFARLIAAFYKQVPGDEILGPMYPPHDLAGAEQRLRDFLIGRFGGPQRYIEQSQPADSWYYCADSKAYYPYVKDCPGGWQRVSPTPR